MIHFFKRNNIDPVANLNKFYYFFASRVGFKKKKEHGEYKVIYHNLTIANLKTVHVFVALILNRFML